MFFAKFLLTTLFFNFISCKCRQSFMTICDTFEDFENYNDTENLSELIIGSETGAAKMQSVNFIETLKLDKYQLSSLIIIRSINRLKRTYHYECLYVTTSLKYFSLYGNILGHIKRYYFPLMPLRKFSLVNNQIESISEEAFKHHEIENFDLSDNLLETIEYRALPTTRATKIITIRNNRLTHITPKSFPSTLEALNLDKNNLRYLQDGVLDNLSNLQQLTMSHNKFGEIPNVSNLIKLKVFDISFNEIKFVDKGAFKDLNNLQLIDLTSNKIYSQYILNWLDVPGKQPSLTISLALNRLKDLHFQNVSLQNKTFILSGNPWNCSRWSDLKRHLNGHESQCDLEFLADESKPYCINFSQGVYNFTGMWEDDVDEFLETMRKNKKLSQCTLALKKHHLLYPVNFFCVFIRDDV